MLACDRATLQPGRRRNHGLPEPFVQSGAPTQAASTAQWAQPRVAARGFLINYIAGEKKQACIKSPTILEEIMC
ncbi:hypothetical protein NDU88_003573 [Pleurodeles waltl]|uniref:Uncharacterized protein n=1 Tax=Pleurodeles waltl TaxID=8319 RepID=A0AAV7NIG9_PLEWA|nr:hypothetical protein NDU88_003573 [Pleurodeles waltl]